MTSLWLCLLAIECKSTHPYLHLSADGTICYGLSDLSYKGPVVIPFGVREIADSAFKNNTNITSLELPEGLEIIGADAFSECSQIKGALRIPNSVTLVKNRGFFLCQSITGPLVLSNKLKVITTHSFSGLFALKGQIVIPESVEIIDASGFYYSSSVSEIYLGSNVREVRSNAFFGIKKLTKLTIYGDRVTLGANAFANCGLLSVIIHANECRGLDYQNDTFDGSPLYNNFLCLKTEPLHSYGFTNALRVDAHSTLKLFVSLLLSF